MPKDRHVDFCLTCSGDSMIDAGIDDGDTVYIRKQPDVENGEIAAVRIGDDATLKRVYKFPDRVVLQAENRAYPPMTYVGEGNEPNYHRRQSGRLGTLGVKQRTLCVGI